MAKPVLAQPSPTEIRAMREAAGFTQTAAAGLVHAALRTWQHWEEPAAGDGARAMPLASWELFLRKVVELKSGAAAAMARRILRGG